METLKLMTSEGANCSFFLKYYQNNSSDKNKKTNH